MSACAVRFLAVWEMSTVYMCVHVHVHREYVVFYTVSRGIGKVGIDNTLPPPLASHPSRGGNTDTVTVTVAIAMVHTHVMSFLTHARTHTHTPLSQAKPGWETRKHSSDHWERMPPRVSPTYTVH
jgi:hypothetical protein